MLLNLRPANAVSLEVMHAERKPLRVFLVFVDRDNMNLVVESRVVFVNRHVRCDELDLPDLKIVHAYCPTHHIAFRFSLSALKNAAIFDSIAKTAGSAGRRLILISK